MARLFRIRVMTFLIMLYGAVVLNVGLSQGDGFYRQFIALKESEEKLKNALTNLEKGNQELEEELVRLRDSKTYAERVLRDKYHVRKDNEIILFFDD